MFHSPILSRISLLVLVVVLVWSAFIAGSAIFRYMQIQEDIAQEKQEVAVLQHETSKLFDKLQEGDDTRALELEARKRLNVKWPNEEVVIIIPGDEEQIIEEALRAQGALEVEREGGFFSRIKAWFSAGLAQ